MSLDLNSILSTLQSQSSTTTSTQTMADPKAADLAALRESGNVPEEAIAGITDRASAEAVASQYGVTLPELPEPPEGMGENGSIFQQGMNGGQPPEGLPPDVTEALTTAGLSDEEIAAFSSMGEVIAYAQANGITLPEPPEPPQGATGQTLSLTA